MSCEAIRPLLEANSDHECSVWRRWLIRRHLQRCSPCRNEKRELDALRRLLLDADPAADAGIGKRLPAMRPVALARPARWVAAVGAAAVVGALALIVPRSTHAEPLDDAIQALTVAPVWKSSHVLSKSADGREVEQWIRMPGDFRQEVRQSGVLEELTIQTAGRTLIHRPDQSLAVEGEGTVYQIAGDGVGAFYSPLNQLKQLQAQARRVGGVTATEQRSRASDGRPLRMFSLRIDGRKHFPGEPGPPNHVNILHLDAETGYLRRWEDPRAGRVYLVDSYNAPFADSLFQWRPPAGTRVVRHEPWWRKRLEQRVRTAIDRRWRVTVHSVDLSATGELWISVSGQSRDTRQRAPIWTSRGMTATDEKGRRYVQFVVQFNSEWPDGTCLLGFAPLTPGEPTAPPPKRISVYLMPQHRPHVEPVDHRREEIRMRGLPVGRPAIWRCPPLMPLLMLPSHQQAMEQLHREMRARARQAYRAKNPCGVFG